MGNNCNKQIQNNPQNLIKLQQINQEVLPKQSNLVEMVKPKPIHSSELISKIILINFN